MANKIKLAQMKSGEVVATQRQVEVLTEQGMPRHDAIRQIGVTGQNVLPLEENLRWEGRGSVEETKALTERQ